MTPEVEDWRPTLNLRVLRKNRVGHVNGRAFAEHVDTLQQEWSRRHVVKDVIVATEHEWRNVDIYEDYT